MRRGLISNLPQPIYPHDLGNMDEECPYCHARHWYDEHNRKRADGKLEFYACCANGKVSLPLLEKPPPFLMGLFTNRDYTSRHFRENIRRFNAALAFTSVGVEQDRRVTTPGIAPFQIHGELHHDSGALLPEGAAPPRYAQLLFYDAREALAHRMALNQTLDEMTVRELSTMLLDCNRFVPIYRTAREILHRASSTIAHPQVQVNINMEIVLEDSSDRRRYNLPTANEVAAIIPNHLEPESTMRDIILRLRPTPLNPSGIQRIHQNNPSYMPLHYVLLFPYGERGWSWDLTQVSRPGGVEGRVKQLMYYSWRLHERLNESNHLFLAGRLWQQYLVDAFASCDQNKLTYLRQNQKALRVELYRGVADAIDSGDNFENIGRRATILPSTYIGGPRSMMQLYQDSMAIVLRFGKPSLFITVTANPHWREIRDECAKHNLSATDRADVVSKVFRQKIEHLVKELKNGLFGRCVGLVRTIEFQKRGLPHMHLLLFLDSDDTFTTPDKIDNVVCAELPNPITDPHLFDVISKTTVHGPCGDANPRAPCMRDGKCSKNFPKPFSDKTAMSIDGYPTYSRRNNGRHFMTRNPQDPNTQIAVDNSWVVPYNPYLSATYNAHINVEVCNSVKAVKYIHKYIFKGL